MSKSFLKQAVKTGFFLLILITFINSFAFPKSVFSQDDLKILPTNSNSPTTNVVLADMANTTTYGLVGCEGYNCNMTHFIGMVMRIINYAITLAFAFVGIIFAYAGYTYMTAQGDSGKVSKAHGMFTKAAVGLFITLSAFLIVKLIMTSLEVKSGELIIELEGYKDTHQ